MLWVCFSTSHKLHVKKFIHIYLFIRHPSMPDHPSYYDEDPISYHLAEVNWVLRCRNFDSKGTKCSPRATHS